MENYIDGDEFDNEEYVIDERNFTNILNNLPDELESLQISLNGALTNYYKYFTNLPLGLKKFNLNLFYYEQDLDKLIDTSKIKTPFGCEFKCCFIPYRFILHQII
jgi:hypothetical protein